MADAVKMLWGCRYRQAIAAESEQAGDTRNPIEQQPLSLDKFAHLPLERLWRRLERLRLNTSWGGEFGEVRVDTARNPPLLARVVVARKGALPRALHWKGPSPVHQ